MGIQVKTLYREKATNASLPSHEGHGGTEKVNQLLTFGEPMSKIERQFTGFSFGGRDIESFDLVVVFGNGGLAKNLYGAFEDTTEQYTEIVGQQYYRTTPRENTLSFSLVTDSMTERQFSDFTNWFRPGVERELILNEHPFRKIMARVSSAPSFNMTPFELVHTIKIANQEKEVRTNEYRGSINLSFVMDYPYWEGTVDEFDNLDDEMNVKGVVEDGIPVTSAYANSLNLLKNNTNITKDTTYHIYYPGTAPSYPIYRFTMPITINEGGVITSVANKYASRGQWAFSFESFKIGENELLFSLPSLFSSYNNAVDIISRYRNGDSFEDLINDIRENVVDYYARAAVMKILNLDEIKTESGAIEDRDAILTHVKSLIGDGTEAKIEIDSRTGTCIMECSFDEEEIKESCSDMILSRHISIEDNDYYDEDGYITEETCHPFISTIDLKDFSLEYKYMYL